MQQIEGSGIIGWKRKKERRIQNGGEFYRHAASTLKDRCRKTLVENTTWYRRKEKEVIDDDLANIRVHEQIPSKEEKQKPLQKPKTNAEVKAVMFIPYTPYGGLIGKLREAELKLENLTGYKLKLVERSGRKIEDLLTSSNPWQGIDCGRTSCLLCQTK